MGPNIADRHQQHMEEEEEFMGRLHPIREGMCPTIVCQCTCHQIIKDIEDPWEECHHLHHLLLHLLGLG
jgi:hypothetical protein